MRVRYYYDKLGRLHHRSIGVEGQTALLAGTEYYYQDNPDGSTTPLISKVDSHGWVTEYTYDDNGNFTEARETRNGVVKVTGYEYDAIGQLIRVNDETDTTAGTAGTTWVFTYDLGGNILTKAAYPYTTGTVGTAAESHTYTYGNAGWKDQLTAFDGTPITYDAIGNPLNEGTWTYTWQHGKQLASNEQDRGNGVV